MGDSALSSGPPGEAIWAMIIMVTIMLVVVLFFCCMPFYKALEKRWKHWDNPENDPRWNLDQFQFSPTSPRLGARVEGNKYNRLSYSSQGDNGSSVLSNGGSFRNICILPRDPEQVEIKMPPSYRELFSKGEGDDSSLGTPPAYYSNNHSGDEIGETKTTVETANKQTKNIPKISVTQETENKDTLKVPEQTAPKKRTYKKLKNVPKPEPDQND